MNEPPTAGRLAKRGPGRRIRRPPSEAAQRFLRLAKEKDHSRVSIVQEFGRFLDADGLPADEMNRLLRGLKDFLDGGRQLRRAPPRGQTRYPIQQYLVRFCREVLKEHVGDAEFDSEIEPPNFAAEFIAGRRNTIAMDRACGDYVVHSIKNDWLATKWKVRESAAVVEDPIRKTDLRIFSRGGERYFFEMGLQRYNRRDAKHYFSGELFASADRYFFLGFDLVNYSDVLLMTLLAHGEDFYGTESISTNTYIGARRIVLKRVGKDGAAVPIDKVWNDWLTAESEPTGLLINLPSLRED